MSVTLPSRFSRQQRPGAGVFSRAAGLCLAVGALYASAAGAATLGMTSDPGSERLSVFDANLDTVTASLEGGPGRPWEIA